MSKASSRSTKRRKDFSEFIDTLIQQYDGKQSVIQVNSISNETGVEKRRLYDLMNVLVACDVCTKTDTHSYKWNGISNFPFAIKRIAKEVEAKAISTEIEHVFLLPESPTIGVMATTFIGTFTYLGLKCMNIRDAALLMSPDEERSKPILRRLYLVAYLLEHIGLLKHAQKIGEYEINADVIQISKESFVELQEEGEFSPDSIEYSLNRFDGNFMKKTHTERREDFMRQLQIKSIQPMGENSQQGWAQLVPHIQGIDI